MREFGGYFELERFYGAEYHGNCVALNSGRYALLYVLKARKVKKLFIPYFLCDVVSITCDRFGYAYEYYIVDENFLPVFDQELQDGEYLYVVNAYGQISNGQIEELQQRYVRIIVDNVMDFFRKPVPGVDCVYSCRKFFGVPDGGYAATDAAWTEPPLVQDHSSLRLRHLVGRLEEDGQTHFSEYHENEEVINHMELCAMSALTKNLMRGIDYDGICKKRSANYEYLAKRLDACSRKKFKFSDGPFSYPFLCNDGPAVRKELVQKKIYIPLLWPNVLSNPASDPVAKDYAQNILSIPCDQRYTPEDMEYLANQLMELLPKFSGI